MPKIHRTEVPHGVSFPCPSKPVTFAHQSKRNEFSIWHHSDAPFDAVGIVVGTGWDFPEGFTLAGTCVLDDGFHTFHLVIKPNEESN
jgi:hypothetical protein